MENVKKKLLLILLFLIVLPLAYSIKVNTSSWNFRFNIGSGAENLSINSNIFEYSIVNEPIENINFSTGETNYLGFFYPTDLVSEITTSETTGDEGIDQDQLINFTAEVPDLWLINNSINLTINSYNQNNKLFFPNNVSFNFSYEEGFILLNRTKYTNGDDVFTFFVNPETIEEEYNVTITISQWNTISKTYNFITAKPTTINKLIQKWRDLKRLRYLIYMGG